MRVVEIRQFGGPDVLRVVDREPPALARDEVRIEVQAAAVNRADILLRTRAYHQATLPAVPGRDGSGIVLEVGPDVHDRAVGDRVVGFAARPGFYAEQVVAPARHVVPVPDNVELTAAAALPTSWLTAFYCLTRLVRVAPGETVLIHAAASGVGHA